MDEQNESGTLMVSIKVRTGISGVFVAWEWEKALICRIGGEVL